MGSEKCCWPMVIFGAGASVPAGVPVAVDMTREMMRRCKAEAKVEYLRALAAITGALQMALGQPEITISDGVDVERVLNAVSLLGDRFTLEFSPFVGAWHPILDGGLCLCFR
jgi:hypothetical protein